MSLTIPEVEFIWMVASFIVGAAVIMIMTPNPDIAVVFSWVQITIKL